MQHAYPPPSVAALLALLRCEGEGVSADDSASSASWSIDDGTDVLTDFSAYDDADEEDEEDSPDTAVVYLCLLYFLHQLRALGHPRADALLVSAAAAFDLPQALPHVAEGLFLLDHLPSVNPTRDKASMQQRSMALLVGNGGAAFLAEVTMAWPVLRALMGAHLLEPARQLLMCAPLQPLDNVEMLLVLEVLLQSQDVPTALSLQVC